MRLRASAIWIALGFWAVASAARASNVARARMSRDALTALARRIGFPDPALAAAVAMAESGGDPGAIGPEKIGSPSYGLWQIHASAHPQYEPARLLDPEYNARAALAVSAGGTNWQPWTTYRTGAYTRYLR